MKRSRKASLICFLLFSYRGFNITKDLITQEQLKKELTYNPETGEFFWSVPKVGRPNGRPAGSVNVYGYRSITIDEIKYLAHRLAWFYMTGEWPEHLVRHKNEKNDDNSWDNLVSITHKESQQKKKDKLREIWKDNGVTVYVEKKVKRATFSNKEVHEAIEEYIKNKTLVNGVYV